MHAPQPACKHCPPPCNMPVAGDSPHLTLPFYTYFKNNYWSDQMSFTCVKDAMTCLLPFSVAHLNFVDHLLLARYLALTHSALLEDADCY